MYDTIIIIISNGGIIVDKKTAVITGASRGIGSYTALKFASMGYNIAICCMKNTNYLISLQKEVLKYGVNCVIYTGDMGYYKNCVEFFNLLYKEYGKVDVLVNNAGVSYNGLLQDMKPEEWEYVIRTNLSSVFYCSKLVIPIMLRRKSGKIINISSVWGCVGASTEVAYSASKGGVNSFTMALAKELAPSNIQVNAIACGIINTDMNSFLSIEETYAITEEIPACRLGTPKEVADFIYQIAESGSYLTGQVIKFDGGWI